MGYFQLDIDGLKFEMFTVPGSSRIKVKAPSRQLFYFDPDTVSYLDPNGGDFYPRLDGLELRTLTDRLISYSELRRENIKKSNLRHN
ncbi:MAG: hypothetical protein WBI20_15145 [Burkholderiaceae bacterium]